MNRRGWPWIVCWSAVTSFAGADPAPSPPPLPVPPAEVLPAEPKPDDFAYVTATTTDRIGRVMAPVYVNDAGPFAFVVDTGASASVVGPRVLKRLALLPDPTRFKLLRGITGSEVVPTVVVDSIRAGRILLPPRELAVVEPRVFADADGIFGADAFANGCLHVNFAQSRIAILQRSCPRVGSHWEIVRATQRFGGLVVVSATVGKVRVAAIIDTGAERSLGNPALLEALQLQAETQRPGARTQVFAATSQAVYGHLVATPPIRMGGVEVDNLNVVFGDFEVFRMWNVHQEPAIVLGMDLLGTTQAMMIDYRRSEVRLLPAGEADALRLNKQHTPSRLPQN
jgi:hypothetical protein